MVTIPYRLADNRLPLFVGARVGRGNDRTPALALPPPWTRDALCAQTDPEAFFPEKGGSTAEAKRICGSCEVRDLCLTYALEHRERFGVWGGLSERERRTLLAAKREPVHYRPREELDAEVARLTAAGLSAREIAEQLHVTPRSVCRARARLRANDMETDTEGRAAA